MTIEHDPLWYKNAIFYQVYVRAFRDSNGDGHGDLRGLLEKLDYLKDLGVDCLWLMPTYQSPLLDDGYDISDYYSIHPDFGDLEDFKAVVAAAHERGLRVITDLVLNHTSDQHPWFQAAREDFNSPFRDYYVWSDTDRKYLDTRIIFLDTEPSNWTLDPRTGQYYWHRFYATQPDLNYDNPAVRLEMLNVMQFWLDLGVDGFRADAVPYLFEREGTNCENLSQTHDYLKEIRGFVDRNYPGRILLCEANQWPAEVRPYFGEGDEFHMGFHFPIMPRLYMALKTGDLSALAWILARTPQIPENCQWCVFLRNHDELTLEMVTVEERQWMWQEYAPDPRMRLNLGIRRRLAPLLDNDRRKIEVANSLLFTLAGTPIVYYGDEIGMGDNIWLPDRNGVRTPMQWTAEDGAGFSEAPPERFYSPVIEGEQFGSRQVNVQDQMADPGSLYHIIKRFIAVRKAHPVLGWGDFAWAATDTNAVAAYWRSLLTAPDQPGAPTAEGFAPLLIVNNLSDQPQQVTIDLPAALQDYAGRAVQDLLSGASFGSFTTGPLTIHLQPYQYLWLHFA